MADCVNRELEKRAVEIGVCDGEFDGGDEEYEDDSDDEEFVMESGQVKKRKRKRKREVEEEEESGAEEVHAQDPLVVFGSDIMMMILSHLDARSVALTLLVCRGWHGVASSDTLWFPKNIARIVKIVKVGEEDWMVSLLFSMQDYLQTELRQDSNRGNACSLCACRELWNGKAHIPRLSQVEGLSKLAAYSLSVMDGKRTRIMKEDLWDHAWEFHFNKVAPEYWRNLDPYWKGTRPLMHRYFHPDGSQTADPEDKVWGGHECCYSIVTSFLADGKIREHYVRINRWPRMFISRKEDWSWEMSNNIYSYSSIPNADKKGGTGPYSRVF